MCAIGPGDPCSKEEAAKGVGGVGTGHTGEEEGDLLIIINEDLRQADTIMLEELLDPRRLPRSERSTR